MKSLIISSFIFLSVGLYGGDIDSMHRSGKAFLDAGEQKQAIELFKNLLQMSLSDEQRAVTQYNIACALLEEEEWIEAADYLEKALEETNSNVSLRCHILYNTIFSRWKILGNQQRKLDEREDHFLEEIDNILSSYQKIQNRIKELDKIEIELWKREELKGFLKLKEGKQLVQSIYSEYADLLERKNLYVLAKISLDEGISSLVSLVGDFINKYKGIDSIENSQEYLELFIERAQQEIPVWDSIRLAVEEEEDERKDAYKGSQKSYLEAIDYAKKGMLEESIQEYEKTWDSLCLLIKDSESTQDSEGPGADNGADQIASEKDLVDESPLEERNEEDLAKSKELSQILQNLSEMEEEDREKKAKRSVIKQGARPW